MHTLRVWAFAFAWAHDIHARNEVTKAPSRSTSDWPNMQVAAFICITRTKIMGGSIHSQVLNLIIARGGGAEIKTVGELRGMMRQGFVL